MQMNAEFKEEQIGTPFVWVGALEGGGKGGGGQKGVQSKKYTWRTILFLFHPPVLTPEKFRLNRRKFQIVVF